MKYIVDIDGTICSNTDGDYANAKPYDSRIAFFNQLFDLGYEIHYWTARGSSSGKDWKELTLNQLKEWGVKYTSADTGKPSYDIWIDDKAINANEFFYKNENFSNRL